MFNQLSQIPCHLVKDVQRAKFGREPYSSVHNFMEEILLSGMFKSIFLLQYVRSIILELPYHNL